MAHTVHLAYLAAVTACHRITSAYDKNLGVGRCASNQAQGMSQHRLIVETGNLPVCVRNSVCNCERSCSGFKRLHVRALAQ